MDDYWLTRLCIQRLLAFIYCIAFLIAIHQFRPLVGSRGIFPVPLFLKRASFKEVPSLFFLYYSDRFALFLGWCGLLTALFALSGLSEHSLFLSVATWVLLWVLYLSFVNIGQLFYGFGWEILLLECGFLAIFLGPSHQAVPEGVIWLYRWVLFRVMFGAGLIKLRCDPCWKDLTAMYYHYETQPLPGPLSWYFHHLPRWVHKAAVLFTHFVEIIVPFGYFWPQMVRYTAGGLTFLFQFMLLLSGNLSWLNYVTLVPTLACFDDTLLSHLLPMSPPTVLEPLSLFHEGVIAALVLFIGGLSIAPIRNLFTRQQVMNRSFTPLHLVNTYGAFGMVTRQRMEIIFEGTEETEVTPKTIWKEYGFKGKPGDPKRPPPQVSPYHFKLDWQLWFAAMSPSFRNPWVFGCISKLLFNDSQFLSLLKTNPFPDKPPKFVRALLYEYHFSSPEQKKEGVYWIRTFKEQYIAPVSLDNPALQSDALWWA